MKGILEKIVYYAKLSLAHNEEAFTFFVDNRTISIQLDPSLHTQKEAFLYIKAGVILENLSVAARYYGFTEKIEWNFDEAKAWVSISLTPTQACSPINDILFNQLEVLQANPGVYSDKTIPADALVQLIISSKESDVLPKLFSDPNVIAKVAPLFQTVATPDLQESKFDPALWIEKLIAPINGQKNQAQLDTNAQINNAAALLLLTALRNTKASWINLGRTYQRIVLTAYSLGIDHAPIYLELDSNEYSNTLKDEFGYTTEVPLLLLRLGYGVQKAVLDVSDPSEALSSIY
jgi:hypothetical protein